MIRKATKKIPADRVDFHESRPVPHFSPEKNIFRGGFHECFAYEGVKNFGMIDIYQCGIIIRVKGWFDSLGINYEMIPDFTGCLMRDKGKCELSFRFNLE